MTDFYDLGLRPRGWLLSNFMINGNLIVLRPPRVKMSRSRFERWPFKSQHVWHVSWSPLSHHHRLRFPIASSCECCLERSQNHLRDFAWRVCSRKKSERRENSKWDARLIREGVGSECEARQLSASLIKTFARSSPTSFRMRPGGVRDWRLNQMNKTSWNVN